MGRPVDRDLRRLGHPLSRRPPRHEPDHQPRRTGPASRRRQDDPLPAPQGHGRDPGRAGAGRHGLDRARRRGLPAPGPHQARPGPGRRPGRLPAGQRLRRGPAAADRGPDRPADRRAGRRSRRPAVRTRRPAREHRLRRELPHRRLPGRPRRGGSLRDSRPAGVPVAADQLPGRGGDAGRRGRLPRPVRVRPDRPPDPALPARATRPRRLRRLLDPRPRVAGTRPADQLPRDRDHRYRDIPADPAPVSRRRASRPGTASAGDGS